MSKAFLADVVSLAGTSELRQGAADPSAGGGVVAPLNSFYFQSSTSIVWQKVTSANTGWVPLLPRDFFGDGSDGDVVIGAGTTTLTRDTYYNNLTIQNGGILRPAQFKAYVRGTLLIEVGGSLSASGNNGVGNAGGAAQAVGSYSTGSGAGGGSTATNGGNGGASASGVQGFAGAGGAGGAGAGGVVGTGGTVTTLAASRGGPRNLTTAITGIMVASTVANFSLGAGGGGGAGSGASSGGGGGGGAGGLVVVAREINNQGTITAVGGNGASTATADAGGGGGGGGGLIILSFHVFSGTAPTVAGGTAGTGGGGAGGNGVAGSAGLYIPLQV